MLGIFVPITPIYADVNRHLYLLEIFKYINVSRMALRWKFYLQFNINGYKISDGILGDSFKCIIIFATAIRWYKAHINYSLVTHGMFHQRSFSQSHSMLPAGSRIWNKEIFWRVLADGGRKKLHQNISQANIKRKS